MARRSRSKHSTSSGYHGGIDSITHSPFRTVCQRRLIRSVWRCALGLLFSAAVCAQTGGERDPLFRDDAILQVTLEAPLTTLVRVRPVDEQYPAKLRYEDEDGETTELDLRVRARGNFRRNPDNCRFPPIRLRFRGADVDGTLFVGLRRVPIVTHCLNTSRYEQGVLREYLAYRILNELTDFSLGVRLFRITYVDTEGRRRDRETFAFAIEHRNRLSARSGVPLLEVQRTSIAALDPDYLNLTSVFQFLIGNTDFSPIQAAPGERCCHNHRLFGADESMPPQYSVAYDFDMTGIVNLPHSAPNPRFNLRNVTRRLYRGRCVNNGRLAETIRHFQAKREAILELIEELPGATSRTRSSLRNYVEGFFTVIDDPERVQRELIDRCI